MKRVLHVLDFVFFGLIGYWLPALVSLLILACLLWSIHLAK